MIFFLIPIKTYYGYKKIRNILREFCLFVEKKISITMQNLKIEKSTSQIFPFPSPPPPPFPSPPPPPFPSATPRDGQPIRHYRKVTQKLAKDNNSTPKILSNFFPSFKNNLFILITQTSYKLNNIVSLFYFIIISMLLITTGTVPPVSATIICRYWSTKLVKAQILKVKV